MLFAMQLCLYCFVCFDDLSTSQQLWLLGLSVGTVPGSNLLLLDLQSDMSLQSDMLQTALHSPFILRCDISINLLPHTTYSI